MLKWNGEKNTDSWLHQADIFDLCSNDLSRHFLFLGNALTHAGYFGFWLTDCRNMITKDPWQRCVHQHPLIFLHFSGRVMSVVGSALLTPVTPGDSQATWDILISAKSRVLPWGVPAESQKSSTFRDPAGVLIRCPVAPSGCLKSWARKSHDHELTTIDGLLIQSSAFFLSAPQLVVICTYVS